MHHLEQMVPYAVTSIKNLSMQRDDGILTVYDMNTRDNLKFYAEDKYWNLDVKDEFMANPASVAWFRSYYFAFPEPRVHVEPRVHAYAEHAFLGLEAC